MQCLFGPSFLTAREALGLKKQQFPIDEWAAKYDEDASGWELGIFLFALREFWRGGAVIHQEVLIFKASPYHKFVSPSLSAPATLHPKS